MTSSLTVLRERREHGRFQRQHHDDTRQLSPEIDTRGLSADLQGAIDGEVRFDKGSRALYATDGSNYRQAPIGVVVPRHKEDVVATMALCRQYGVPVLSRGGGTSLAGQCCNVAVVMDFSKYMHRILEIDPQRRIARVQPGCVLDDLRNTAQRQYGLTFGPDPETHDHCTIGGMLGNNSCGVHSLMSKNNGMGLRMSDNTHALDILTYEGHRFTVAATAPEELERIIRAGGPQGRIYGQLKALRDRYADVIRTRMPKLERRVSGYNLDDLLPENGFNVARALVGTESTCVTILEAQVNLIPAPKARSLLIFGYPDIYTAAEHLLEILDFKPTGLEGIDHLLFKFVKDKGDENANLALLPPGGGFLLVEFGGDSKKDSDAQARACMDKIGRQPNAPSMKLYDDPEQEEMIWKVREGSLGSTAWVPGMPDTWEGWEDSAVPVPKVAGYLRDLRALLDRYGYPCTLYGHLGQGCIHTRIPFDLYTAPGIEKWRSFIDEATDLVNTYGGSYSGEHGDGQSRGEWLPKLFGPELMAAFREFKEIWDPQWKMNPGKVIEPYKMTENLRVGPDYNPPQPRTYFKYPADQHSFARAALRCVGVGKCRREGGGTMCPSYMVTREEMHSTRGRARLLFEMMNGEVLDDGWRDKTVYEALDLCLACKGCKGDCPVNVDMATYKAEFRAHYFGGLRALLRPRYMYAFGWIHIWSHLARLAPNLANLFTQTPVLCDLAKFVAGMHPQRQVPHFAPQSFKQWFATHRPRNPSGSPVVLYADTFNNYYLPDTAKAAVEVLEDAGFRIIVPMEDLCCGRPLFDYGFLNMARRWLHQNLDTLRPYLESEVPVVVLEPSCWSVFTDELTNLLPESQDAQRLSANVFLLGEFLKKKAPHYQPPRLDRKAILHKHCHHKSELKHVGDWEGHLLREMGVEYREPETGCCGMAGAFGYERGDHYDVSIGCGQRVLLPQVHQASDSELLIADGFSCREQIRQETDRHAMHLAEVIQLAKRHGPAGPAGRPEGQMTRVVRQGVRRGMRRAALGLGAGLLVGAALGSAARIARRQRSQHRHTIESGAPARGSRLS